MVRAEATITMGNALTISTNAGSTVKNSHAGGTNAVGCTNTRRTELRRAIIVRDANPVNRIWSTDATLTQVGGAVGIIRTDPTVSVVNAGTVGTNT